MPSSKKLSDFFEKVFSFSSSVPPSSPALFAPLRALFADCADFSCQRLATPFGEVMLCWMEGLASGEQIAELLIRPLRESELLLSASSPAVLLSLASSGALWAVSPQECRDARELSAALNNGRAVLLCGEWGLSFDVRGQERRSVGEPKLERSVLGARDAFTETYRVNTALLRQRLRSSELKITELTVGRRSATRVGILYIDGIARPDAVDALRARLEALDVDGITALGDLESRLAPRPRGAFPQFLCTERPDRLARFLLQGRVGILCDGLPLALAAPCTLPELLRVAEDRAQHALPASALLLLRYAALLVSLLLPALYAAVAMYHPEMIPIELLQSIIAAKQYVPFSTAAEMLGMLAAFGLLQEAGLRLPEEAGTAVSIIGTLIVGQSAVEAQVVSPIAVIVVALSGIAGYTLPNQQLGAALRLWRFVLVLCAVAMGMFGLMAGGIVLLWRLCAMEFAGVSYLYPLTDGERHPLLRGLLHLPLSRQLYRDAALTENIRRQA